METSKINFSTVLAASMHDMKNSLCMLLQSMDLLNEKVQHDSQTKAEFAQIHYEIARVNSNLLQLLAIYKNTDDNFPLNIEEHFLDDLIDELLAKNEIYISHKNIQCECKIQSELSWFFDIDLVSNLLNDVLANALRYTRSKILISAKINNNMLELNLVDDGPGYPENMLNQVSHDMNETNLTNNRTGLGLYFANLIAKAHENNQIKGEIQLCNGGPLNGSVFTLRLP
jgi:K+-sensing histidine kinase KdpD